MPTMLEKWTVKEKAKSVLIALRAKFENVPAEIEEVVLAMSDSVALESLLEHVIHSDTLDEFATAL